MAWIYISPTSNAPGGWGGGELSVCYFEFDEVVLFSTHLVASWNEYVHIASFTLISLLHYRRGQEEGLGMWLSYSYMHGNEIQDNAYYVQLATTVSS